MKQIVMKLFLSIIMILGLIFTIRFIYQDNLATSDGSIHLIILDIDETVLFDGDLAFFEGDSFFDILNRNFLVTCANQNYQIDSGCEYTFNSFAYKGKVILGIKNEDFDIITDWYHSFLAIEVNKGNGYYLATEGVSNIKFNDQDLFKISVRNPMG
jgi:hypothetical protein